LNDTLTYLNVFNLNEGSYTWNVTCFDNSENINSSSSLFTIDLTYPSLTSEIIETISTNSIVLEFNISEEVNTTVYYGTDLNLSNNLSILNLSSNYSINLIDLSSNTFYYYNLSFCDRANNCNYSDNHNFTTLSVAVVSISSDVSGGGGSGGGSNLGSGSLPQIVVEGDTVIMYTWSTYNFVLGGEQHSMEIRSIEDNRVTLLIKSEPIEVILEVGETKILDVNGNGIDDLEISLISIEGYKVVLDFEVIEEIEEENEISEGNLTSSNLVTGAAVKELEGDPLIGGIISGGIVLFGLIFYFIFRKK
jgi:hypothetical protein